MANISFEQNFSYKGTWEEFVAPYTGFYTLEVWGAEGGRNTTNASSVSGKGGYSVGDMYLTKGEKLYVYVGGRGTDSNTVADNNNLPRSGGWNGGGNGVDGGGGGGGATDIRRISGSWNASTSLNSRLIVAGGAGGVGYNAGVYSGGYGGGTTGGVGGGSGTGAGGTQTSGYARGQGGSYNNDNDCGGGGGGYWGGYGGSTSNTSGGGGSGFIDSTLMGELYGGNQSIPAPSGGTQVGHTGHGYARISMVHKMKRDFSYSGNMQYFTAPVTGPYTIETWGAEGGRGTGDYQAGKGAYAKSIVNLEKGEIIKILVGGQGNNVNSTTGTGGGGSFVARNNNTPLAVSGGGGGAYSNWNSGTYHHGQPTNDNVNFLPFVNDVAIGQGGFAGYNGWGYPSTAGAGGGFYGDGMVNTYSGGGSGGYAFVNGGGVGKGYSGTHGGFGGGGGSTYVGGGGGGFTGGHAGTGHSSNYHAGGGGGSFFTGAGSYAKGGWEVMPSINGGTQTGHSGNGYVRISFDFAMPDPPVINTPVANEVALVQDSITITWEKSVIPYGQETIDADLYEITYDVEINIESGWTRIASGVELRSLDYTIPKINAQYVNAQIRIRGVNSVGESLWNTMSFVVADSFYLVAKGDKLYRYAGGWEEVGEFTELTNEFVRQNKWSRLDNIAAAKWSELGDSIELIAAQSINNTTEPKIDVTVPTYRAVDVHTTDDFEIVTSNNTQNQMTIRESSLPHRQMVFPTKDMRLKSPSQIKNIDGFTFNGSYTNPDNIKIGVSVDEGKTYFGFADGQWQEIGALENDEASEQLLSELGMTIPVINAIPSESWNELINFAHPYIRFVYMIEGQGYSHVNQVTDFIVQSDATGTWNKVKKKDYTYTYPKDDKLKVELKTNGSFKINY